VKIKKLTLNRETIRLLSDQAVVTVAGGRSENETECRCTHTACSQCCDGTGGTCGCYTDFTCGACTGYTCAYSCIPCSQQASCFDVSMCPC
jgi:hypothetical protein